MTKPTTLTIRIDAGASAALARFGIDPIQAESIARAIFADKTASETMTSIGNPVPFRERIGEADGRRIRMLFRKIVRREDEMICAVAYLAPAAEENHEQDTESAH